MTSPSFPPPAVRPQAAPRVGPATGSPLEPASESPLGPAIAPPPQAAPRPGVFPELARPRSGAARLWGAARRPLAALGKLVLVGILTYGLMFNFSVVRGSSMSPSIHDGDRILVDHLSVLLQGVRRGDIVVLQYPLDPSVDYIKRVIGLPGDVVRVENGHVLVNGRVLDEPYVASPGSGSHVVRVLPGHYFVLGDNRPHSSDSREFGLVHESLLRGRVDLRVWPFERAGTID